ncbi:protein FAM110A [Engraulis encrasicolus]|uniref:protein FAM110A n=1 Tax=Engraulis encrasicolus TaxID=184585 RepID=UPI002FD47948
MPVETLRPSGPLGGGGGPSPFTSGMPFRILNKGPDYFRRGPAGCLELGSNHNNNGGGTRKMSAVERLEADKAKYVKSQQVALNRQEPVKPPIIRKPLMSPGMMLQCRISTPPARKVPRRPLAHADAENGGGGGEGGIFGSRRGPHLNLEILNNLINVCDGPMVTTPSSSPSPVPSSPSPSASSPSPSSGCKRPGTVTCPLEPQQQQQQQQHPLPSSIITAPSSSPLNGHMDRRPPPVPARAPRVPTAYSSPNTVTVRRVDVRPQAAEVRKPPRIPLQPPPNPHPHHHHPHRKPRQIAQPQAPPSLPPPPPPPIAGTTATTNTTTTSTSNSTSCPSPSPASLPATLPSQQQHHPPAPSQVGKPPASPLLLRASPVGGAVVMMPPASPAVTRISSTSSRGSRHGGKHGAHHHPSLHRSKSDLSDRYSRATADLERFFNYCGLDPEEVEGMGGVERFARAASDIISVSKLRSVSTPSSECGDYHNGRHGGGRGGEEEYEEEEEEDEGPPRPNERVPYSISVIERNARVIKWLYGIRQARDTSQNNVSNV